MAIKFGFPGGYDSFMGFPNAAQLELRIYLHDTHCIARMPRF